jgi:hypothetical protein
MNTATSLTGKLKTLSFPKAYIGPVLITGVLLAAHLSFGILDSYQKLAAAILASFATEAVLHKLVTGRWRNMSSASISGISF